MILALLDILKGADVLIYPLGLCSLVMVFILIERSIALRKSAVMPDDVVEAIISNKPIKGDRHTVLTRIIEFAEHHPEDPGAVKAFARLQVNRMERGLPYLDVIYAAAPLLGLTGTVWSLLRVFSAISGETGLPDPVKFTSGVALALSATLLGFLMGAALGILIAVGIIHSRTLSKSLMPWVIASQTIPILAIAPIIIVALGSVGLTGLIPKAIISMYLCFFPVTIGMVKGFASPDGMQLDLMRTYNASRPETFWKLRWPSAIPYLFASLKVAISISLVGAIVGELPTGAQAGIGARLLSGSYYGQTIQIWSALVLAALMAAGLIAAVAAAEKVTLKAMGAKA
jgi:ABC-type nitrate/sulfonate/bicarbonate transport system permease component